MFYGALLVTIVMCPLALNLSILGVRDDGDIHNSSYNEAGSGCLNSDRGAYFDYISVDDEDYSEDGSAEETIEAGTIVHGARNEDLLITDFKHSHNNTDEDEDEDAHMNVTSVTTGENDIVSAQIFGGGIVPEDLVLSNETHGSLNGNILILNSEKEVREELYFESNNNDDEEETSVESNSDVNVILHSGSTFYSGSDRLFLRFLLLKYFLILYR